MSPVATSEAAGSAQHEKRSAALSSVLAALGVTLFKLLTGLLTGSLGMLSEAAHSGIDLIAAIITLLSIQVSDRPADADHNYGHGKVESLSAGIETVLMLGSCIWILTEAIHRIIWREHLALKFSVWPFAALLLSIAVDYTRFAPSPRHSPRAQKRGPRGRRNPLRHGHLVVVCGPYRPHLHLRRTALAHLRARARPTPSPPSSSPASSSTSALSSPAARSRHSPTPRQPRPAHRPAP